ncbi:MAG TPA: EAL domain-containing protein [Gemmatimonadales bacterium]|nr:EAL domain-containing protein [Gemmatimonadales bacterium]
MTLRSTPLQSRFGRRLLLLFVGCAVVPIAVVAGVSYRHVTQQLRTQSESRLRQSNKALGLAIFERLLLLDATLKSIPPRALQPAGASQRGGPPEAPVQPSRATRGNRPQGFGKEGRLALGGVVIDRAGTSKRPSPDRWDREASRTLSAGVDLLARRRFVALEFVPEDTAGRVSVFGRLDHVPALTPANQSDLSLGLPLILGEQRDGLPTRIYLIRRVQRRGNLRGLLVGEISPQFLWGTLDQNMPSPATLISVTDESGHLLFASSTASQVSSDELMSQVEPGVSEAAATRTDQPPFVSAASPILLDEAFAAPVWTLVLSQTRDEVLGPMVEFTKMFLGVVLVSSLTVLLLSLSQIRRSLMPLAELQQGTRRIAQRDFASRVSVSSRDEFEELATSFNAMASQLGRQFQALSTAAEIDRAVLSATNTAEIVDTLLVRVRDVFPCSLASVTLIASNGSSSLTSVVHDYRDDTRRYARVHLRSADVQDLLDGPELQLLDPSEVGAPSYLEPLLALEPNAVVVLPLRFQHQLMGIIALGDSVSSGRGEDDRVQVRRLADQVAIALVNAQMLEQVRSLAYYDSLTGLPNRLSYKERLSRALEDAHRSGRQVAAFFIDLDHFSRVNDSLGHEAGDQLLQQVALRLRGSCREREDEVGPASHTLTPDVARLGGDEFTVLMPGLSDPEDAAKLARRILSSLAHPVRVGDREIFVNASIGIAFYPQDAEDLETLLMHADAAMYQAKEQGGGSYQTYSRSMNASALQRLTLENSLRRALDREEFELHYQPIVDARTGATVGTEALVRWRHPDLGLLLPSEFIALAEENGMIVPLGEWVLRRACLDNRAWQARGLPPIRVNVNLSSRQIKRSLIEAVGRVLQESALDSRYLGLELTESVLVNHQKEGTDTLHALRAMGLHLSVDDFGTGYSSFSYLKRFPLDTLKIDRCFIREITSHPDDAAITIAMIAMGHALGLKVVAEGVETDAQSLLLRRQGCDAMQGYLFGRPVTFDQLTEFLAGNRPTTRTIPRRTRVPESKAG